MKRGKKPDVVLPKYMPAAIAAARQSIERRGPGIHHVTIYHDDWCALLAGTGPCNCEPEVEEGGVEVKL